VSTHPLVLVVVLVLGLLAACTPAPPTPPEPAPPSAPRTVERLWNRKVDLVGWPAVGDEAVASFSRDSDGLAVAGWDLDTGRRLWRHRAVPGNGTAGVDIDLDLVEAGGKEWVAWFGDARQGWQRLIVAPIGTGRRRALKEDVFWATSGVVACPDRKAFCFTGYREWDDEDVALRVDPVTGRVERDAPAAQLAGVRFLGDYVFTTDVRPPKGVEQLGLAEDGVVRWRRRYTEVFGKRSTSDAGWWWEDDADRQVVIGTGWPMPHWDTFDKTGKLRIPTRRVRTVGLDRATGRTLWSLDGVELCGFADLDQWQSDQPVPLCRIQAGSTLVRKTGKRVTHTSSGHDVDVIGVDPSSGAQLWSVPIGGAEYDGNSTIRFTPTTSVVALRDGAAIRIDPATGTVVAVGAEEVLSCSVDRKSLPYDGARWSTGAAVLPCDRTRRPVPAWSADAVEVAGQEVGDGRWVLATREGLLVVRV